jgi:hypothetical protein
VHTVAPSTAPGVDGHRLGAIVESPGVSASGGGGVTKTRNAAKQSSTRRRSGKTSDAFDPNAPLRMSDVWAEVRAIEAGETAESSDEDTEEASWSDYS